MIIANRSLAAEGGLCVCVCLSPMGGVWGVRGE